MIDLAKIDDPNHYLKKAMLENKEYIKRFNQALKPLQKKLSKKQFDDLCINKLQIKAGKFNESQYIQNACELTVLSYFAEKFSSSFVYENKVNPPKDVDLSITLDDINYNIEIKCVENSKYDAIYSDKSINPLSMFGRYPDKEFLTEVMGIEMNKDEISPDLDTDKPFVIVENRDMKLKDFLESAQSKFSDTYSNQNINILFICIGGVADIDAWDGYIYGHKGILQEDSFVEHSSFDKIDMIIISNLEHRHSNIFNKRNLNNHWKLDRAYNIFYINKYSKGYEFFKTIDFAELMPDMCSNTIEFVKSTNSSEQVDPFRHTYFIKEILEKRGDYRFNSFVD